MEKYKVRRQKMSKSNAFAQDLNRAAREPIGGLSIKQIRQQVIDRLQGKRTVSVDYRRIRTDQHGREDDEPTGKETLEIVAVMKYFTVVKRHGLKTCILHQDMFYIAGIGGTECL